MQKELLVTLVLFSSYPKKRFFATTIGYLNIGLISASTSPKSTVFLSSILCFAGLNLTQSSPIVAKVTKARKRRTSQREFKPAKNPDFRT